MPSKNKNAMRQERKGKFGWHATLRLHCIGKPSRYKDDDGNPTRIRCDRVMDFPFRQMRSQSGLVRDCTKKARASGWSNPRSLGEKKWLCPSCLQDLLEVRLAAKHALGYTISPTQDE